MVPVYLARDLVDIAIVETERDEGIDDLLHETLVEWRLKSSLPQVLGCGTARKPDVQNLRFHCISSAVFVSARLEFGNAERTIEQAR